MERVHLNCTGIFVESQVKTCYIFFYRSPRQQIQLTLSHICISVLVPYQHDDLFGVCVILGMFYCFQHIYSLPGIQFQKD